MPHWIATVPKSNGLYFYRPQLGMPSAVVVRTTDGFLFHGVDRLVTSANMIGEFWSEPIKAPDVSC